MNIYSESLQLDKLPFDTQTHILKQFDWFVEEDQKRVFNMLNIIVNIEYPGDKQRQRNEKFLFYRDWSNDIKSKYNFKKITGTFTYNNDQYTYEVYVVHEKDTEIEFDEDKLADIIDEKENIPLIISNGFIWREVNPAILLNNLRTGKTIQVFSNDKNHYEVIDSRKKFSLFFDDTHEYHRENGPAMTEYNDDVIVEQGWYKHGKLHNENGIAYRRFSENGIIELEQFFKNGKLHNENGPAFIEYDENGRKTQEVWYINGLKHREDDEPVEIKYLEPEDDDDTLINKDKIGGLYYYKKGKLHRQNGPAAIHYDAYEQITSETWYIDGVRHREDGPAVSYYDDGSLTDSQWWINGEKYDYIDGNLVKSQVQLSKKRRK